MKEEETVYYSSLSDPEVYSELMGQLVDLKDNYEVLMLDDEFKKLLELSEEENEISLDSSFRGLVAAIALLDRIKQNIPN